MNRRCVQALWLLLLAFASADRVMAEDRLSPAAFETALRLGLRYRLRAQLQAEAGTTKAGILAALALAHCLNERGEPYLLEGSELDGPAGFPGPIEALWPKVYQQLEAKPPSDVDYLIALQLVTLQRLWAYPGDKQPQGKCASACSVLCEGCLVRCQTHLMEVFQPAGPPKQWISYGNDDLSVLQHRVLGFHSLELLPNRGDSQAFWAKVFGWLSDYSRSDPSKYAYRPDATSTPAMNCAGLTAYALARQHGVDARVDCGRSALEQVTGKPWGESRDHPFRQTLECVVKSDLWPLAGHSGSVPYMTYTLFTFARLMLLLGLEEVPVEGMSPRGWHDWAVEFLHLRLADSVAARYPSLKDWAGRSLASLSRGDVEDYLKSGRNLPEWSGPWCDGVEGDGNGHVHAFVSMVLEKASPTRPVVQQLVSGPAQHFHGLIPQYLGLSGRFLPVDSRRTVDLLGAMKRSPVVLLTELELNVAMRLPETPRVLFDYMETGGALIVEDLSGALRPEVEGWVRVWKATNPGTTDLRPIAEADPLRAQLPWAELAACGLKLEGLSVGGCHDSLFVITGHASCPLTPHCAGAGKGELTAEAARRLWDGLVQGHLGLVGSWSGWDAPPPALQTPAPAGAAPAPTLVRVQAKLLAGDDGHPTGGWPRRRLPRWLQEGLVEQAREHGIDVRLERWQRAALPPPQEAQLLVLAMEPGAGAPGLSDALKRCVKELGQRLVVFLHTRGGKPDEELEASVAALAQELGLTKAQRSVVDASGVARVVVVPINEACREQPVARQCCGRKSKEPDGGWVTCIFE